MNTPSDRPHPSMNVVDRGDENGIQWVTCEAPLYGAVNGYVRIPEGHPWHGMDYWDIDVEVHWGLTFLGHGWIGFDTLHLGDIWPGTPQYQKDMDAHRGIWWTPAMVADEARKLARQVAEVAS